MKLWIILYCNPNMILESLRISAPNRISAITQAQAVTPDVQMVASNKGYVGDNVICNYAGEADSISEPCILSAVRRKGKYAGERLVRKVINGQVDWLPELIP